MQYAASLDIGTSSVRAGLYDEHGRPVPGAAAQEHHAPVTTAEGGVEHDPDLLVAAAVRCLAGAIAQIGAGDRKRIRAVGVSTFWHSILGVTPEGRASTPVLMWADTRSVAEVCELRGRLDERALHRRTGCLLHTSYVGPRLRWVSNNRPQWLRASARWMSPGEYLFLRLFGRTGCGVSMASGTGMLDHARMDWDTALLEQLPIGADQLNPVVPAGEAFVGIEAEFATQLPELTSVPWFPAAGDGACSNVGAGCTGPDRVAVMIGTSGALRVMRSTCPEGRASEPIAPWGLWKCRWDEDRYLIGGALSNGGNLVDWLRQTLRLPHGDPEEMLETTEPDGHGLTVLPFLAGERCPGWRGDARGAITGLAWSHTPAEIYRAGLEAVAYRFRLIHALAAPVAEPDHLVVGTGGALLASPAWAQMLADVLGRCLTLAPEPQASARGAAMLALRGVGLPWKQAAEAVELGRTFVPDPSRCERYLAGAERQARLYEALVGPRAPRAPG